MKPVRAALGLAILAAILAGCEATPKPPCSFDRPAALFAFPASIPYVLVPVSLGHHEAMFIFDTGAFGSFLSAEAATAMKLRPQGRVRVISEGAAGEIATVPVIIPPLRFANGDLDVGLFLVAPLFGRSFRQFPLAGLLGDDIISNWAIDLDRAGGHLILYDEEACAALSPPWPGRAMSVPMILRGDNIRLTVLVDGRPMEAVLDTGAPRSALSGPAARTLGIDTSHDPVVSVGGIGLLSTKGRTHELSHLSIGGRDFGPLSVVVMPVETSSWQMILGEDFMRRHRLFISYRQHRLFIADAPS